MLGAIEQLRKDAQGHLHGLHFLTLNARDALPLLALEIGLRERRIEDHVGEDVERRIERLLEGRQGHAGDVELRAGGEHGAQLRQRVADLQRRALRRPFVQHVERETRGPRRRELVGRVPGVDQERHVHLRNGVTLGEHDLEPVGERRAGDRREAGVRRRTSGGKLGAIRTTRHDVVGRIGVDLDDEIAVAEPARGGRSQVRGGRRRDPLARHLIVVRVAGIDLVHRQDV